MLGLTSWGTIVHPLEAVDPLGVALWDANNEAIVTIMRSCCSLEEKLFLKGYSNTSHAWTTLREHHEQIGPITQVTLIRQLLQLHYRKSEHFSTTSVNITESVQCIYAMGMPTANTFTLIMMMNAMDNELPHVRDHIMDTIIHSTASDPYTPPMALSHLVMEQQLVDSKSSASPTLALAASTTPTLRTTKTCTVCGKPRHTKCCTNPKCPPGCRVSHTWPECFSEGGSRAGQHDAVLQKKADRCCIAAPSNPKAGTVSTGKSGNICYNQSGWAYFVDSATNTAFMLQDVPGSESSPTAIMQEFVGLASNVITPDIVCSFSVSNVNKYDALFMDLDDLQ